MLLLVFTVFGRSNIHWAMVILYQADLLYHDARAVD